jgi:hypothetical protein
VIQAFYSSPEYKEKQRQIAKLAWQKRRATFKYKTETRTCLRSDCGIAFTIPTYDPKKYCSQSCGTHSANIRRGERSLETRKKIADSLRGRQSPWQGVIKVPRKEIACANPICGRRFLSERWKKKKYCSIACSMKVIGGRPTSPKASKGKNGIRKDISSTINFYSRWEANVARLYTYLGIKWEYAPRSFDIGGHTYTPDFYLPDVDTYIEVKNFWWQYSRLRDENFRRLYPEIRLKVILGDQYRELERRYAHFIPKWEFKNSK